MVLPGASRPWGSVFTIHSNRPNLNSGSTPVSDTLLRSLSRLRHCVSLLIDQIVSTPPLLLVLSSEERHNKPVDKAPPPCCSGQKQKTQRRRQPCLEVILEITAGEAVPVRKLLVTKLLPFTVTPLEMPSSPLSSLPWATHRTAGFWSLGDHGFCYSACFPNRT